MTDELKILSEGAESLGIMLDELQVRKFSILITELSKWNHKVNLTAIRDSKEIVVKHLLDSLTLPAYVTMNGSLLDIGSGGGFPSIPVCIIRPDLYIVSVDAVQKKIMFQKHIARTLNLDNFTAVHARGESLLEDRGERFDFVVSRAFSSLKSFAELSRPLLADDGKIVAMKGSGGKSEALEAEATLESSMMKIDRVIEFLLPVSGDSRSLVVISKIQ